MTTTAKIAFPLAHWEVRAAMRLQLARSIRLATYTGNGVRWVSVHSPSMLWLPEGM